MLSTFMSARSRFWASGAAVSRFTGRRAGTAGEGVIRVEGAGTFTGADETVVWTGEPSSSVPRRAESFLGEEFTTAFE